MKQQSDNRSNLFPVEIAAIQWLVDGELPVCVELRRQAEAALVAERDLSSVGCFTKLDIAKEGLYRIEPLGIKLTSLQVECAECPKAGIGFVLHLSDGFLDTLESFTYADIMPDLSRINPEDCTFSYINSRKDDLKCITNAKVV